MTTILLKAIDIINHEGDSVGDALIVENCKIKNVGYGLSSNVAKIREIDGFITPGFIDAHLHIAGIGLSLLGADLRNVKSVKELVRKLAEIKGPIAFGRGWDQESLEERRYPTRADLDRLISDRPALAVRICGHVAVLNTIALNLTKPWERFPNLTDKDRGVVMEDAVGYVIEKLMSKVELLPLIKEAVVALHRSGIRGASSMSCSLREIEALLTLESKGELPIYVSCYSPHDEIDRILKNLGLVHKKKVGLVGVKLFADGSLGARTAYLREPYSDVLESRGQRLLSAKEIAALSTKYLEMGLRIATHAIGDAALDEVLEGYSKINIGGNGRIEHVSVAWDEQIQRIAELEVYAVVQPRFRVSDWWIDKRLGERYVLAYRFKSMLKKGVKVALSTDAPVEPFDPVETFRAAVGDCNTPSCREEESLTPKEVIKSYTYTASKASGGPLADLGEISKGKPAFLSWSSEDPRAKGWRGPLKPLELC